MNYWEQCTIAYIKCRHFKSKYTCFLIDNANTYILCSICIMRNNYVVCGTFYVSHQRLYSYTL